LRFLDANIFVYAFYRPSRRLSSREQRMKEESKRILEAITDGKEKAITTMVHLSETVNILKHGMDPPNLADLVVQLLSLDNLRTETVDRDQYLAAAELGRDLNRDPNDALAVLVMREHKLREVYTYDGDFDELEGIVRLPKT
jgi:predicted nucleic acid-binding protein